MPTGWLRFSWRLFYRFCQVYGYRWNLRIRWRLHYLLRLLGSVVLYIYDVIYQIFCGPFRLKFALHQVVFVGHQSVALVMLVAVVTGGIFALQIGDIFSIFRSVSHVGAITTSALMRELAPVLTGFLAAGRAGSAMTAQIASMKASEQIDALEVMAVSPVSYLVIPRFLGSLVSLPLLCCVFMVMGGVGAWGVARFIFDLDYGTFMHHILRVLTLNDLILMLVKALVFGGVVGLVACYVGLHAPRGAGGVSAATTKSVVSCLLLILVLDVLITFIDKVAL